MKRLLTGLITVILIILIELLVFSFSVKEICVNTISDAVVKSEVSSKVIDEVVEEFPELDYEALKQIEEATRDNVVISEITSKYLESIIDSIINGSEIKVPNTKEELNKIINDNIQILDSFNVQITEEQKDLVVKKIIGEDNKIEVIYTNVANSLKENITESQYQVIKIYKTFTSSMFRYILIGLILLFTLLIAIIKRSYYRWLLNIIIAGVITGFITSFIIPRVSNYASLEMTSKILGNSANININNLINTGYLLLIISMFLLLIYIIINIILKKNKKASN